MTSSPLIDVIGWISTGILVLTVGRQAYSQWKEGSTKGLSKWTFIGQLAASTGFVVYSFLLDNIVFVVSNLFLLMIAAVGQALYLKNRRREGKSASDDT
jgi:MtN3 and saliva related transmembrane protein